MTRMTAFSSPLLLGFDQIEKVLERAARSGDGYPPYNIERLGTANGSAALRITLAVAGFRADELAVEVEASRLTIRGSQVDDDAERTFLHRGIAARQFERTFVLAEGIDVSEATLESGLLSIDLTKPVPDDAVRRVPISERS